MSANGQITDRGAPRRPPGPIIKAAEADSWIDGFAFRDRSKREAEALVADTKAAYEKRKQEGFEQGRREGAAAAALLLAETQAKVDRYLGGIESEIVDLALDIVRRIAGDVAPREMVARLAHEAVGGFRREQALTVTVAPENLSEARAHFAAHGDPSRNVTIEADRKLGPLDCRVESPYATVDAGLDAQIEAIRKDLKEPSGGER